MRNHYLANREAIYEPLPAPRYGTRLLTPLAWALVFLAATTLSGFVYLELVQ